MKSKNVGYRGFIN